MVYQQYSNIPCRTIEDEHPLWNDKQSCCSGGSHMKTKAICQIATTRRIAGLHRTEIN